MKTTNADFRQRCYDVLKSVPAGKVTTYAAIARALDTKAWRAVGSAMAKNQQLIVIPCHRVVRSDGAIGQYALGADKKRALLLKEGVSIKNGKVVDMEKYVHHF